MTTKEPRYRIHLGVRVTQRVLWTLVTDLDDNPTMNFPTVEAAMHWLHLQGEKCVDWRSGNYSGRATLGYDEPEESDIVYHVGTPKMQVQEVLGGEDHSTHPIVRSKRLGREVRSVRQLERD